MSTTYLKSLSDEQIREFLDSFDTILTDCDGVLWLNVQKLFKTSDVLNTFRSLGKKIFFVTNNSLQTTKQFVEKCKNMGFIAEEEDMLCTSLLVATYLKELNFKKKVYIVGSEGIAKELAAVGIESFGWGPDVLNDISEVPKIKRDPEVGAVIIAFDEHLSYLKMVKAATYLRDENCLFIATNMDENFPGEVFMYPGTGAFVRFVETCVDRKPIILGKPEPYMSSIIKKTYNVDPKRTLMIGDRANTDILLGTRCGFKTLLVLSGVTSLKDLETWKNSDVPEEKEWLPDFYTDQLGDLLPFLEKYKAEKST
ncbi:glycerol-3-phosphate phosphatase-like [Belonocnema kinseyi]|uniref:glycerol-3-phosphate phosphatase-like n=1 Tax=Belonocnema kinseyi TaxID=2817044 RepID=UPI00143CDCB5|nr:glycerol-3-phosphate phosphatase-like [Belonocnema kinseyi]XP_033216016.1 glycerol-3-phosphate phosphatase-like [Belonocnema kinseyi]XP_033216017.1 glycerol-3-phosphate phosphatase-like [Belonocnema kinseyi]XP_033216018.1 glycerol-3-phosphate phosphatase-like [Belonocnema kinseyi]XP_033216019.1 glycerol-3-phosphate phosphatase-like [Belonocnema kinseyi]XP_033216020.1 glycerol-3-phosphate phosphatase-like [Belonocnema kinseyi]XP_033216022.1 glycerol-3-phosphate phosphatase-like [Belonocnema